MPAGSGERMTKNFNAHVVIFSLAVVLALATASECHSITHLPSLLYGAVLWGWWALIASSLWRVGRKINLLPSLSLRSIAIHVLVGLALSVVHLLLLGSLGFTDAGWRATGTALTVWTSLLTINRLGTEFLLYGFLFGITGVIQSQIRAQREAIQSLSLQKQLSAAHLQALQMQLEPHFLFNTLNAITTLVELGRQKAAVEMLSHLNSILKSTLASRTPEKVPLSQELELVGNYLAIEQVRFADRLRIEFNVDPTAVDGLVQNCHGPLEVFCEGIAAGQIVEGGRILGPQLDQLLVDFEPFKEFSALGVIIPQDLQCLHVSRVPFDDPFHEADFDVQFLLFLPA